jgi:hypothetical protein
VEIRIRRCRGEGRGDFGRGAVVGPEVDEADLAEGGLAGHVERPLEGPGIDHDGLARLDEFRLIDAGTDAGLPGEAVLAALHHVAGRLGVAADDPLGDEVAVLDGDPVGVADALLRRG